MSIKSLVALHCLVEGIDMNIIDLKTRSWYMEGQPGLSETWDVVRACGSISRRKLIESNTAGDLRFIFHGGRAQKTARTPVVGRPVLGPSNPTLDPSSTTT